MKNKYIILLVLAAFMASCTKSFEDFNTSKKLPAVVSGESVFTSGQKELVDHLSTPNVNLNVFELWAQYWTETTYTDEANYDIVNRTIADLTFREYYRDALRDLDEAKTLIGQEETGVENTAAMVQNKIAIADILMVFSFQNLVDIFGDVPYTQALDINNLSPTYDKAVDIYTDLINRLKEDIGNLDDSEDSYGGADLMYGGDVASWKAFGNSLLVKLGITIADADPTTAQQTIEGAYKGAISSADQDGLLQYQSATPNANQIYEELVATGRHDFVGANTLIDIMNSLSDPRLPSYFNMVDTSADGSGKMAYLGGDYGFSSPYPNYSHVADNIQLPDFHGIVLTYDETLFYLAEAAARGYSVGGTADELYNAAIQASCDFWGAGDATAYIASPGVAYDANNWKQLIGTQSWIAFYCRGLQGYTNWRRLDYPVFNTPSTFSADMNQRDIPTRFTYPINEQTLNGANYKAASDAIGGDELTTQIFWDKNKAIVP